MADPIPHNKLVRDLIPQIIEKDGNRAVVRMLTAEEYPVEIARKFGQQGQDYINAPDREERLRELSDILQLVNDAAIREGSSIDEVEKIRIEKLEQRGGFGGGTYLEQVLEGKG